MFFFLFNQLIYYYYYKNKLIKLKLNAGEQISRIRRKKGDSKISTFKRLYMENCETDSIMAKHKTLSRHFHGQLFVRNINRTFITTFSQQAFYTHNKDAWRSGRSRKVRVLGHFDYHEIACLVTIIPVLRFDSLSITKNSIMPETRRARSSRMPIILVISLNLFSSIKFSRSLLVIFPRNFFINSFLLRKKNSRNNFFSSKNDFIIIHCFFVIKIVHLITMREKAKKKTFFTIRNQENILLKCRKVI